MGKKRVMAQRSAANARLSAASDTTEAQELSAALAKLQSCGPEPTLFAKSKTADTCPCHPMARNSVPKRRLVVDALSVASVVTFFRAQWFAHVTQLVNGMVHRRSAL
jgi:hypothetical protein